MDSVKLTIKIPRDDDYIDVISPYKYDVSPLENYNKPKIAIKKNRKMKKTVTFGKTKTIYYSILCYYSPRYYFNLKKNKKFKNKVLTPQYDRNYRRDSLKTPNSI